MVGGALFIVVASSTVELISPCFIHETLWINSFLPVYGHATHGTQKLKQYTHPLMRAIFIARDFFIIDNEAITKGTV
jgi:hypothetical protein